MYRITSALRRYPRQYWLLIFGALISTTGMGMIWPFLTIYMRQKLGVPLTTITALLTLDSTVSIAASFVAGPIADRFGRKWVLVLSLVMMGLIYMTMSGATSLGFFAVLMALRGAFVPLYRIGGDAMVADLVPEADRVDAYSMSRIVNNVGVALGPSIGGFVTSSSYTAAFFIAAVSLFVFGLLVAVAMRETLPVEMRVAARQGGQASGYGWLVRDTGFQKFVLAYTMIGMASSLVFVLLASYAKENFGIPESQSGFIMAVNALMVVFLQYAVTAISKRFPPLRAMAVSGLLYALGVGAIALGRSTAFFVVCMVVLTLGELILQPTSTTYAANAAPPEMRGRYMSIYGLGWGISHGFGPVVGGILNDTVAPAAIWYNGFAWALGGALVFWGMVRGKRM